MILVKLQELTNIIQGITCKEATLFEQEEEITEEAILGKPVPVTATAQEDTTKRKRARIKDGTMTAEMISHRLTKELGREITTESVIRVGKTIKARPVYSTRQHVSRYSPEEVNTIIGLYRSFNQL